MELLSIGNVDGATLLLAVPGSGKTTCSAPYSSAISDCSFVMVSKTIRITFIMLTLRIFPCLDPKNDDQSCYSLIIMV